VVRARASGDRRRTAVSRRRGAALSLSVVLSTYEAPEALDAVLRALADQSDSRFEVIVADDGSGPATREVVERWGSTLGDHLTHVWQPDKGFRAARTRNLGALRAQGQFLVFLDGDCVPRRHFVRATLASARPGWFIVGRRFELDHAFTERVLRERLPIHRWSVLRWRPYADGDFANLDYLLPRDRRKVGRRSVPEFVPHNDAYCCIGVSAFDFAAVNGYDMRYEGWGEEDVDLAFRLRRHGLRAGHAGARATVFHLWHPSRADARHPNHALLHELEAGGRVEAVVGLREFAAQVSANRTGASSSSSEPVNR
jgi:glycosyltransferase involved in cell wall biosynthesis